MTSSTTKPTTEFPPVRACIFDVDGLLIDSEDIYTEAYNNILHEYGTPDYPWSVKARQQSRGREGGLRLLEWAQLPISLDDFQAKVTAQQGLFRKCKSLPGVPELLTNLSQRSSPPIHLALASSAGRVNFGIKTGHLPDITCSFPEACRVFGEDVTKVGKSGKPAPDIFLLALQRINESLDPDKAQEPIKPAECVVFEDSIAGVEAGRRAGMRVVWVPHPGLLEVCRGREEMVLAGITEQNGMAETWVEDASEKDLNHQRHQPNHVEHSLVSKDGWAERLTSLQEFRYHRYGIRISS